MRLTARGSGYYIVSVDGADVSRHTAEREAIEAAAALLGTGVVTYRHDYVVDVEEEAVPAPEPEPEPEPEPAPDPTPEPDPEPPPAGQFFRATWDTGEVSDGGRFTNVGGNPVEGVLDVVAGAALGWTRTPNVCRITHLGSERWGMVWTPDLLEPGRSFWLRLYYRDDETQGISNHPLNLDMGFPPSAIQAVLFNRDGRARSAGLGGLSHSREPEGDVWTPYRRWMAQVAIATGVWYRYELHVEFYDPANPDRFRVYPRLYDGDGVLVADSASFVHLDYGIAGNDTLASFYVAGDYFYMPVLEATREFGLGQEGPAGDAASGESWYLADLALSYDGWIGEG